jgi:hypothetical protein
MELLESVGPRPTQALYLMGELTASSLARVKSFQSNFGPIEERDK